MQGWVSLHLHLKVFGVIAMGWEAVPSQHAIFLLICSAAVCKTESVSVPKPKENEFLSCNENLYSLTKCFCFSFAEELATELGECPSIPQMKAFGFYQWAF